MNASVPEEEPSRLDPSVITSSPSIPVTIELEPEEGSLEEENTIINGEVEIEKDVRDQQDALFTETDPTAD